MMDWAFLVVFILGFIVGAFCTILLVRWWLVRQDELITEYNQKIDDLHEPMGYSKFHPEHRKEVSK